MRYQFLLHDGFIYRRPPPKEPGDSDSVLATDIWDGTRWRRVHVNIASEPAVYGRELSEHEAQNFLGDEWQP
jgi:hypothetical protein